MDSFSKKELYFLIILIVFAISLRFLFIFKTGIQWSNDALLYNNVAVNFLNGRGLIQTIRSYEFIVPPLYPLFLSFMYLVFGGAVNNFEVIIVHSILGALSCFFIYLIAKKTFDIRVGIISSLYFAIYPGSIWWNNFVLTETFFIFLLLLFLYYLIFLFSKNKISNKELMFSGFLWGICNLARANLLFFIPFLFFWIFLVKRKDFLRCFLFILLGMIITIAPWTFRNYIVYKKIIPIGSYSSQILWLGNNEFIDASKPYSSEFYKENPEIQKIKEKAKGLSFSKREQFYLDKVKDFAINNPANFIENFFKKFSTFWRSTSEIKLSFFGNIPLLRNLDWLINNLYRFLIYLFPVGIVMAFFNKSLKNKYHLLLLFIIIYYSFLTSIMTVVGGARYRLPIMPFVIIYMFYSIIKISEFILNKLKLIKKKS